LSAADIEFLGGIPVFGGLAGSALAHVTDHLAAREVDRGTVLVREGEPANEMFVVRAGAVEVVKNIGDGCETRLAGLRAGACFGEMSLIDIQPRSAGVRALEHSIVWSLSHAAVAGLWSSDPQSYTLVVMNVAREISRRLRRADALLASIHRVVAGFDNER